MGSVDAKICRQTDGRSFSDANHQTLLTTSSLSHTMILLLRPLLLLLLAPTGPPAVAHGFTIRGDQRVVSSYLAATTTTTTTTTKISDDVIDEARNTQPLIVSSMPDPLPSADLRNRYYFLRHGQSTANVDQVISSSRSLAYSDRHGLTELGNQQSKASAIQLLDVLERANGGADGGCVSAAKTDGRNNSTKVVFVSSPFARARQTAEACLDGLLHDDSEQGLENRERIRRLGLNVQEHIVLENGLMERYFGRLDGEAIYTYAYVWPLDKFNATHTAFDVESVAAVCTRLRQVVGRLEEEYDDCHIVWVSHADVLQIAQLYGANVENVGAFSSYRFQNGEVRAMKSTPDSLPDPIPLEPPERGTVQYETQKAQS